MPRLYRLFIQIPCAKYKIAFRLRNACAECGCDSNNFPFARVLIPPEGAFCVIGNKVSYNTKSGHLTDARYMYDLLIQHIPFAFTSADHFDQPKFPHLLCDGVCACLFYSEQLADLFFTDLSVSLYVIKHLHHLRIA